MSIAKKILLVEGEADKCFFEEICKRKELNLNNTVLVAPPRDLDKSEDTKTKTKNTKNGAINFLRDNLLSQLDDGHITHIAVVVDADYGENEGYANTLKRLNDVLSPSGFLLDDDQLSTSSGLLFNHTDGFAPLGVWIMPDNSSNGMLEDWIISCIHEDEQKLFQEAQKAVSNLGEQLGFTKFDKSLHTSKAEIATWLAWQKQPGHGLYYVADTKNNLLDNNYALFKDLEGWLIKVFNNTVHDKNVFR